MMKPRTIVIIDNYDSFTYNIYQILSMIVEGHLEIQIHVIRNDEITIADLEKLNPSDLIISPGPGMPTDAGISLDAIKAFSGKIPILGVCLGHQAIAQAFGGKIIQAKNIVHGKVEPISIDGKGVLRNLPNPCPFTRYHSLAIDPATVPDGFEVTSHSEDGEIMGIRHKKWPVEGVQFHPESIGSPHGAKLLSNFLYWKRDPIQHSYILNKIIAKKDLTFQESIDFMDELTAGDLDESYIAGMLCAMAAKGYSADEIAGFAGVLVDKCRRVHLDVPGVLDNCGTGGDGRNTFNISSFAAVVAAACGAKVAKHGNRLVSSKSGSTDFYEALGIPTTLEPQQVAKSIKDHGFGYMAAPLFHSAMRHVGPVRQKLKIKTIMNCLGPLANPARADYQIIGVYDRSLIKPMAQAAKKLGVKRVLCVHSQDGLDEISPAAPTKLYMIDQDDQESESIFNPKDIDLPNYSTDELKGGDAIENARIAHSLCQGDDHPAIQDAVCLNAGAALYTAMQAIDIADGYRMAKSALQDGRTARKISKLIEYAKELS